MARSVGGTTLEDKVNWPHSNNLTRVLVVVAVWTLVLVAPAGAQTRVSAGELTSLKALGSKSAPITVEVFSDFQCPSCRTVYQSVMRPVIDNYVSAGKVYLVHRDFPLPLHKYSREAARWANAAAQIGKFEKVEQTLYEKQETWSANGNIEAVVAAVLSPADLKKARALVQSGHLDAAIDKDVALGQSRRVNQTPMVFVTHAGETTQLPPGGVTYSLMKQYFDYLLRP